MLTKWETVLFPCKECEGHGGCYTIRSSLSDDVLNGSSTVFRCIIKRNLVGDGKAYYLCKCWGFFITSVTMLLEYSFHAWHLNHRSVDKMEIAPWSPHDWRRIQAVQFREGKYEHCI